MHKQLQKQFVKSKKTTFRQIYFVFFFNKLLVVDVYIQIHKNKNLPLSE